MSDPKAPEDVEEYKVESVTLTIDPSSVTLDSAGRVKLADQKIASAIISAAPTRINPLMGRSHQNIQCNEQCQIH